MIPSDIETTTQWRVVHDSPVPGAAEITRHGTESQVRSIEQRMVERGLAARVEARTIIVGGWGDPEEVQADEGDE